MVYYDQFSNQIIFLVIIVPEIVQYANYFRLHNLTICAKSDNMRMENYNHIGCIRRYDYDNRCHQKQN